MKALVFARRSHFEKNAAFARALVSEAEIDIWTDERWTGGSIAHWWGPTFYKYFQSRAIRNSASTAIFEDMIQRCRLLRHLECALALRMASAALDAWSEILEGGRYDMVLATPVDSFVLDALMRAARKSGIPALHAVGTPFSGRIRFTVRGELVGSMGIPKVIDQLIDDFIRPHYRPDWLIGTNSAPLSTGARRLCVDMVKTPAFWLYRQLARDRASFSFAPRRYYSRRMFATPQRFRAAIEVERNANRSLPQDFAFIPLQFYPETTSDYWVPELAMIDHHAVVQAVSRVASAELPVVIKEHPAAVGRRSASFLRALSAMKNVFFAPLLTPPEFLVRNAALILGPGSSTMLQAITLGKRALFLGSPFYGSGGWPVLTSADDASAIRDALHRCVAAPISTERNVEPITHFVESTAEGSLGPYQPVLERANRTPQPVHVSDQLRVLFADAIHTLANAEIATPDTSSMLR